MIKNILFDLGGVIIDINYQHTIKAFENLGLSNASQLYSQAAQTQIFDAFEVGDLSEEAFLTELQKYIPSASLTELKKAWNAMLIGFPLHRIEFLQNLRNSYPIYLFSNTNAIHEAAFNQILTQQHPALNFANLFKGYYLSHKINARKPHVNSFKKVLSLAGVKASETLFVDDSIQHVEGAKKAGLQAYLLPKNTEVEPFINSLLIALNE
jgi:FMN phosphatase YigB (HAD superfamily)